MNRKLVENIKTVIYPAVNERVQKAEENKTEAAVIRCKNSSRR